MRDRISKGLLTAAAASGVLAIGGGYAIAVESEGVAAGSPGVLSGNSVQVPVQVPVNVCGNTADVVGAGNPAFGNACANASGAARHAAPHGAPGHGDDRTPPGAHAPGHAPARESHEAQGPHGQSGPGASHGLHGSHGSYGKPSGSSASAIAKGSPGVGSGNVLQAPLDIPLNACGNSANLVGVLNPAFGNGCANNPPQAAHGGPEIPGSHEGPGPHEGPGEHEGPEVEVPPLNPGTPGTPDSPGTPGTPEASTPPDGRTAVPDGPGVSRTTPDSAAPAGHPAAGASSGTDMLASTGSGTNLFAMAAISAGLLLGGGILYRRGTAARR
ncbi:chaplin family protein [Streptomyces odonnellii]|uniref:chaplin family protein n=1 Tax=Streptomyces odonnellii TaxID=1417980 RepID=UPI000626978C|nr:chaplin family protein [Streptomyces odonnellii]